MRTIEQRLGSGEDVETLDVVFSVGSEAGLQMLLKGEPVQVNAAINRIETEADKSKFDA